MPEPSFQYLKERLEENANAQPMVSYCSLCPTWKAQGTALEAREAAREHRANEHPELLRPRKTAGRRMFSQKMTKEREAEIEEERRQRMRSLGLA